METSRRAAAAGPGNFGTAGPVNRGCRARGWRRTAAGVTIRAGRVAWPPVHLWNAALEWGRYALGSTPPPWIPSAQDKLHGRRPTRRRPRRHGGAMRLDPRCRL
jgi:hypothetical protein